jgi:hypothetical protein
MTGANNVTDLTGPLVRVSTATHAHTGPTHAMHLFSHGTSRQQDGSKRGAYDLHVKSPLCSLLHGFVTRDLTRIKETKPHRPDNGTLS